MSARDFLSTTSQGGSSFTTSQGTTSSTTSQGTTSSTTSQGTTSSTTSLGTTSFTTSQGTTSSATSQGTSSSTSSQGDRSPVTSHGDPLPTSSHTTRETAGGASELQKLFRRLQHSNACRRWRNLGRELGLEEWVLEAIAHDNPRDLREQLYKMLLEWEESRGKQAKPDLLIAALRGCDLNKVADMAEDLCKAQANPLSEGSHMYRADAQPKSSSGRKFLDRFPWVRRRRRRQTEQQIQAELKDWYTQSLSRLHPIPWCQWVEKDFSHMFTNLTIVEGLKHQGPVQRSWQPGPGRPVRPQQLAIDTEEGLVGSLCGSGARTVAFIEGAAGIGKSCLCRRLALSWAKDALPILREKLVFVFILEARTLTGGLEECINGHLFPRDFPLGSGDIYTCVTECQENCLFIIDGVDELTRHGKQMVQGLLEGRQFRRANVLLTGRPESAEQYIQFVDIHMRITGFSLENAKLYIHKFFDDNQSQVGEKLIERLERDKNLEELSQTPFTTLLICLLAEDSGGDIPTTRNDIMKDILQLTVRRYVSRPKSTPTEDTTVEAILRAAAQVAYKGETTGTVVFEESDLDTVCTHKMSAHLLLSGLFNRDFILSRLDSKGCCYFPHKSIQDFLCARYLADLDADSLKTTLAHKPDFHKNPTLCEMLLNMLRDQADKYGEAMTFYWSENYTECEEAVLRSALTVADSGTLDTIIGVFWQYRSVHNIADILYVHGGERLWNLVVRRTLPFIILGAVRNDQNALMMHIPDTSLWFPYSRTTPDPGYGHVLCVRLPAICEIPLFRLYRLDSTCQGVKLPWILPPSPREAIRLTERPVQINVLCVCVIPSAEYVTGLSSLKDRPRSSDLIVFILKPRHVTYEDSVYLRVLEMCKRAHSNPVRVRTCTVVTEVETKVETGEDSDLPCSMIIGSKYHLSMSPLQIHYNRHCPF